MKRQSSSQRGPKPAAARRCCDGLCNQGRRCPAFAPGVIEGPHRRGTLATLAKRVRAALRALWRDILESAT